MIIIPDVHGRTFWKEAVKGRENEEIVFLGDYIDPYGYEGITPEDGIIALEDIIKFKQDHPNNVHLLLGNHDAGYIWESVCSARRSRKYYGNISHLFTSNLEKFDLVHKIWIDKFIEYLNAKIDYDNIDFFLNNALHCGAYSDAVETFLGMYSYFRSYVGPDYGSSIWADVREMSEELPHIEEDKKLGYYQIFGHTQLENDPIVKEDFACLDVRRYFELTDTEILKDPTCGREYDLNNLKKG